ncbi:hypothetical protein E0L21_12515 [Kosakonia quasisacchari]|uniref:Uncharacterized protein n=1 Tax=Kosakonia quasisacchari TaxID=2529380 RepID=A0A4V2LZ50_9ENTR|nr:hypothetical protein [Kosakonia quasisacchari]TCC06806.1 hypothetical protein E0L21_12515 [Kosakonia quasisacchari]
MKHENFNTVIALLGLLLAAFSTYTQLKPEKDELDLVVTASLNPNAKFELKDNKYLPEGIFGANKKLAGPASIMLEVSNNMNRTVTIKKIKIELVKNDKGIIYYPQMINVSDKDTIDTLHTPVTIEGHSVIQRELSINIPVHYEERISSCFSRPGLFVSEPISINNIEYCYFSHGIDFLGNKVQLTQYEGGGTMFTKTSGGQSLTYKLTIKTGDNSEIIKMATLD